MSDVQPCVTIELRFVVVVEDASDFATAFGQAHRLERLAAAESEGADRLDGVGDVDRFEGWAVCQDTPANRGSALGKDDVL